MTDPAPATVRVRVPPLIAYVTSVVVLFDDDVKWRLDPDVFSAGAKMHSADRNSRAMAVIEMTRPSTDCDWVSSELALFMLLGSSEPKALTTAIMMVIEIVISTTVMPRSSRQRRRSARSENVVIS